MKIDELHNIMPIVNIPSVTEHGILSHNLRKRKNISNHSVALQDVQDLRARKIVPVSGSTRGKPLHDFANLYFDAHNPMLSRVREHNSDICVLCISPEVLNLPGVVITDRNAACDFVGFYSYPEELGKLDFEKIYATWWKHNDDPMLEGLHKNIKCAEALVPNVVEPKYITSAYVCNKIASDQLNKAGFSGNIIINSSLFF